MNVLERNTKGYRHSVCEEEAGQTDKPSAIVRLMLLIGTRFVGSTERERGKTLIVKTTLVITSDA